MNKSIYDEASRKSRQDYLSSKAKERRQRYSNYYNSGKVKIIVKPKQSSQIEYASTSEDFAIIQAFSGNGEGKRTSRIADGLLLFIEVAALILLGYVIYRGINIIREINSTNQPMASVLSQEITEGGNTIFSLVLPSGHTSPSSPGGAQPVGVPIDQSLSNITSSELGNVPSQNHPIFIEIPAIGVSSQIVQGDGWEELKIGIGHHIGSANPGQPGNLVLSAHNDIFGELFRDLDQLVTGDEIVVYNSTSKIVYKVETMQVVDPARVDMMLPSEDPTITLISCYPYFIDTERIIIQGKLSEH